MKNATIAICAMSLVLGGCNPPPQAATGPPIPLVYIVTTARIASSSAKLKSPQSRRVSGWKPAA